MLEGGVMYYALFVFVYFIVVTRDITNDANVLSGVSRTSNYRLKHIFSYKHLSHVH